MVHDLAIYLPLSQLAALLQPQQPADPAAPWWHHTFRPNSFLHFLPAGIGILSMWLFAVLGRLAARRNQEYFLRMPVAWAALAYAVFVTAWWVTPPRLSLAKSLPLHLCDLAVLIAPLALIFSKRWLRALLFFWGIGLSTQAFLTPTVNVGALDLEYHFFWMSHIVIVGFAFYDFLARGFRPTARDLLTCVLWGIAWFLTVFFLNQLITGANYGYVGQPNSSMPTIVDKLGSWPRRAFLVAALGILGTSVVFVLVKLFVFLERLEGRWPVRILLTILFLGGAGMTAAGIHDALNVSPKPIPHGPTPAETAPQPAPQPPPVQPTQEPSISEPVPAAQPRTTG